MDNVKICDNMLDDVRIWQLAVLQFEKVLQECFRSGIMVFKIYTCGGISSDMRSRITFYDSAVGSLHEDMASKMNFI